MKSSGQYGKLEENGTEHEERTVCICSLGFVPLKRMKGYKATSIR